MTRRILLQPCAATVSARPQRGHATRTQRQNMCGAQNATTLPKALKASGARLASRGGRCSVGLGANTLKSGQVIWPAPRRHILLSSAVLALTRFLMPGGAVGTRAFAGLAPEAIFFVRYRGVWHAEMIGYGPSNRAVRADRNHLAPSRRKSTRRGVREAARGAGGPRPTCSVE
jgi:hypothetical protein